MAFSVSRAMLTAMVSLMAVTSMVSFSASGAQTWGRLSSNGYDGLLVAISDKVPEDQCYQVVTNLKASFKEASKLLYDATWRLAMFRTIVVSLPPSWDPRACGVGAHEEARVSSTGQVDGIDSGFRLLTDDPTSLAAFVVDLQLGGVNLTPYTVQPVAKCRAPGKRVVIPHDFLTRGDNRTVGLKGRLIVKEWAKFRYGVFDETHKSATDPSSPSFYTPFSSNGPEEQAPTRCSNQPVRGQKNCVGNMCHFMPLDRVPENEGVYSSLMSYPELSQVTQFCNHSTHNPDVPTKHNILCDGRSTAEVIRSSLDFLGISPGPVALDTRPQFKFIQPKKSNIVFVVQATQDMDRESNLWVSMRGAIFGYLHLLSNAATASSPSKGSSSRRKPDTSPAMDMVGAGRQVGVVEVAGDEVLTKRPREVTPASVTTERWLSHYPLDRNDFCLECGIKKAVELLTSTNDDRRGEIIVFAREQYMKTSQDLEIAIMEALDRGIMIHSVIIPSPTPASSSSNSAALRPDLLLNSRNKQQQHQQHQQQENFGSVSTSPSNNGIVRQVSVETRGKAVLLDDLDGNAQVHSMAEMLEALEKIIPPSNTVKLYQELKMPSRETMTIEDRFPVDAGPEGEFLVRIHSKEIPRQVAIVSPQGETPEPQAKSEGGIRAPVLQTIRVQPWPSPSKTGQWQYKIQAVSQDPVLVEVWMPYGAGTSQDEAIAVEGWTSWDSERSPMPSEAPLIIYARVTVGQRPVRLAEVVAKVKRTTSSYSDEVEAVLRDDGLGDPDSTKNDGIYSGYFTGFLPTPGTRYQVTWVVTAAEGIARVPTIVGREPKSLPDDSVDPSGLLANLDTCCGENIPMTALPAFKRIHPGPTFTVDEGPVDDVYPPSRILDLRARVDVDRGVFLLSWTAPGGNFNEGTADRYELRYSLNRTELILESGGTVIQTPPPSRAGTEERMEFPVGQFSLEYGKKYYFAVRGFHGRFSRYSNIVPAAVPEPATEAPPLTGSGFESTLDAPTRGTFSLTAGVVGNQSMTLLIIIAGVASFIVIMVAILLCYCAKRRKTAAKAADGAKVAPNGSTSSNAPDVVASLEKGDHWDAKMTINGKNGLGSQEASPVLTPDAVMGANSFMAASQILDGRADSAYYSDNRLTATTGYANSTPPAPEYGLEYGAYFQGYHTYDPATATYGVVAGGHGTVNNGYYGPGDYNTLETQRLVASSSDRMSYQSSQQSDTNSSSGQGENKKFVHFSADTLSNNGGQQHYGTYPAGFKGPPPPVPPKPGYASEITAPRLNESHCSVNSVDHKKIRTVTQV